MEVAAYARDEQGAPPPILQKAWKTKTWGLPEAGGWRDQRAGELKKITAALNVYDAVNSFWKTADRPRWIRNYPQLWKIVEQVREMQKNATE